MSHNSDETTLPGPHEAVAVAAVERELVLVLAWSQSEPQRSGETARLAAGVHSLGRGPGAGEQARVLFGPERPGEQVQSAPFFSRRLSREQLRVTQAGDRLVVERVGKAPTFHRGQEIETVDIGAGDVIRVGQELVLVCVSRARRRRAPRFFSREHAGGFGQTDRFGLAGESEAAWALRDQLAFAALADTHVLVHGPSGVGKELAARAVHGMSSRAATALVARNASTLPTTIAAAELFGNRRDYPNAGTPERPGLVGRADGGTLFLDELGELPLEAQSQLLRFLDDGEYQRIGEAKTRRADVRVVAATNRDPAELRPDLFARFKVRVLLPELSARREDIGIIARQLVARAAERSPELAERFIRDTPRGPELAMTAALAEALIVHDHDLNVRALDALLWQAMAEAPGDVLELTPSLVQALATDRAHAEPGSPTEGNPTPEHAAHAGIPAAPVSDGPSREDIVAALAAEGGNRSRAAERLQLKSRYVLYRLMKSYGISS